MDVKQRYIVGCIFFTLVFSVQAQSIRELVKDDRRKSMLEGIRPSRTIARPPLKQQKADIQTFDNSIDEERRSRYEIDELHVIKDLEVNPHLLNIPKELILKIEPGTPTKTMIVNGKFMTVPIKNYEMEQKLDQLSQRHRLQGIMISTGIGGLNLSGHKEKKISKKAREILENVFGMKVEE